MIRDVSHRELLRCFDSPDGTERRKGKPGLRNEGNDSSPVKENITFRNLFHHVMKPDVVHNEWERVHERKEEKGIGDPSVENLQFLVGNSSE